MTTPEAELADWRRRVQELYAAVRADAGGAPGPAAAHRRWREGRDVLFRDHPQTPVAPDDPLRDAGVPYWPYDPAMRFRVALDARGRGEELRMDTGTDGVLTLRRLGTVDLPSPVGAGLAVWWLEQYGGGVWLPLVDATAGGSTYGGGRYVLDTAKGADLGGDGSTLEVDLNFSYHPSCRWSPAWTCPLAPAGNRIAAPVEAGERLAH